MTTSTTPTPSDLIPPPLPNPAALWEKTRLCRGRLHAAKGAGVLRNLRTVEQEKTLLVGEYRPSPFDGIGRPGGPTPADRYADLSRSALAALDAVEVFEAAIAAAEQRSAENVSAFNTLDTALRAADGEVLDPGRVELLTTIRRQLDGAHREHIALLEDLDDARPLMRSFRAKAERLRDAAIVVTFERIISDVVAALARMQVRVNMLHASTDSAVEPVRALATRWEARTGQPVRVPRVRWPNGTDPFAPPTLEAAEGDGRAA